MEKIEMVRAIGFVQSGLVAMRANTKKTEEQDIITRLYDELGKVVDGLVADAKNGA